MCHNPALSRRLPPIYYVSRYRMSFDTVRVGQKLHCPSQIKPGARAWPAAGGKLTKRARLYFSQCMILSSPSPCGLERLQYPSQMKPGAQALPAADGEVAKGTSVSFSVNETFPSFSMWSHLQVKPGAKAPADGERAKREHLHPCQRMLPSSSSGSNKLQQHLQIKPGAKAPADGEVTEGSSYVDESMVTGESVPVSKRPRSPIISGAV